MNTGGWSLFLGAFVKLQKATVSFTMSVHLSAWNSSAPTVWICIKFNVRVFFENLLIKFKFRYNKTIIMGTLHEEQYTFLIISRSVLLRMRNVSDRCRENQNTHFMFNNFFFLISPFTRWHGKILWILAGHWWQYGAHKLHDGYLRLQIHTQNMQ